jgi:hypothetical protein
MQALNTGIIISGSVAAVAGTVLSGGLASGAIVAATATAVVGGGVSISASIAGGLLKIQQAYEAKGYHTLKPGEKYKNFQKGTFTLAAMPWRQIEKRWRYNYSRRIVHAANFHRASGWIEQRSFYQVVA